MPFTKRNSVFLSTPNLIEINPYKRALWKTFVTAKKNESFMFEIYKGEKDINVHVSLEDDVKFKGFVSRSKDLDIIEIIFSQRFYDFEYKDEKKINRFFLMIQFGETCDLNVVFKMTLSDRKRSPPRFSDARYHQEQVWKDPENFFNEI